MLLKTFLITMQGGNRRILDCIHMFWGCDGVIKKFQKQIRHR